MPLRYVYIEIHRYTCTMALWVQQTFSLSNLYHPGQKRCKWNVNSISSSHLWLLFRPLQPFHPDSTRLIREIRTADCRLYSWNSPPFKQKQLLATIRSIPKADRFTPTFYKTYNKFLTPFQMKVFNSISQTSNFPYQALEAHTSLVPKLDNVQRFWSNCHQDFGTF